MEPLTSKKKVLEQKPLTFAERMYFACNCERSISYDKPFVQERSNHQVPRSTKGILYQLQRNAFSKKG